MNDTRQIRFDDGAAYERMMGAWSRIAGARFLEWWNPPPGLRWIDVGCGNGAFTELVAQRCAPAAITGIDPSEAQLQFARSRPGTAHATYVQGDAMALPFAPAQFDAAVMALVLFFVPEPQAGVRELARVLAPGGIAGAYTWDIEGGGMPHAALGAEMRDMGFGPPKPPRSDVSGADALRRLWEEAGFLDVQTTVVEAPRTFASFDELWETCTLSAAIHDIIQGLAPPKATELKDRVRAKCTPDAQGRITWTGRANAVKGRKG